MNHTYQKLTGKKRNWGGFSQVWLGADHLLILKTTFYREQYKRFAFSDIQAIVVSEGPRRVWWMLMGAVLLVSLGFFLWINFGKWFFAGVGLVAIVIASIDFLSGPRCRCVLHTGVSRERLPSVSRLRAARKLLAVITPLIESVQGHLPNETVSQALATVELPQEPPLVAPINPPEVRRSHGYIGEVFFGLLFVDSLLLWTIMRSMVAGALGLLFLIYSAELLLGIVAMIRAHSRRLISSLLLIPAFVLVIVDLIRWSGPEAWHSILGGLALNPPKFDTPIHANSHIVLLTVGWRAAAGLVGFAMCMLERFKARS